jgi:ABC-type transport system involved in multi-copper enzyme maturation permease subunit
MSLPVSLAVRAEWAKFRTVRGWVIAVVVAASAVAGFGIAGGDQGTCYGNSCTQLTGPGGEAVSDSFYFVHRPLGDAAITARVASLTSSVPLPRRKGSQRVVVPWAKAGIIVKASLTAGSPYAAMMVTGGHGARMQYDFTGDVAGPSGTWLRLVRTGATITGYASSDGAAWTRVATVTVPGLPAVVQAGLFVTSPQYTQTSMGVASISGSESQSTAVFRDVTVTGAPAGAGGGARAGEGSAAWDGTNVGGPSSEGGPATGYSRDGGGFAITGSGDIAPVTYGPSGIGATLAQTLGGVFVGLVILAITGAMFVTDEYRRGLIRVTLAASPRRGRVLAAKASVVGAVAFAAGLAGTAVAVLAGQRVLREHGVYLPPVTALTQARVIVGTAAVIAVCAVLAVAIGTVVRRGAAAVAAVIALIVAPYVLAVPIPVLPLDAADWLMRLTPAAAFAVEGTVTQYPQVDEVYAPAYGYFPLAPWAGFAVLCGWALAALAVAYVVFNRRDA